MEFGQEQDFIATTVSEFFQNRGFMFKVTMCSEQLSHVIHGHTCGVNTSLIEDSLCSFWSYIIENKSLQLSIINGVPHLWLSYLPLGLLSLRHSKSLCPSWCVHYFGQTTKLYHIHLADTYISNVVSICVISLSLVQYLSRFSLYSMILHAPLDNVLTCSTSYFIFMICQLQKSIMLIYKITNLAARTFTFWFNFLSGSICPYH